MASTASETQVQLAWVARRLPLPPAVVPAMPMPRALAQAPRPPAPPAPPRLRAAAPPVLVWGGGCCRVDGSAASGALGQLWGRARARVGRLPLPPPVAALDGVAPAASYARLPRALSGDVQRGQARARPQFAVPCWAYPNLLLGYTDAAEGAPPRGTLEGDLLRQAPARHQLLVWDLRVATAPTAPLAPVWALPLGGPPVHIAMDRPLSAGATSCDASLYVRFWDGTTARHDLVFTTG